MAVERIGDNRTAPSGRNKVEDGRERLSCPARNANLFAGEESCGRALREDDRGAAALRSDMPHRGRGGRARVDQTGWVLEMAGRHRQPSRLASANVIAGRATRSAFPWLGLARSDRVHAAPHTRASGPDHAGRRVDCRRGRSSAGPRALAISCNSADTAPNAHRSCWPGRSKGTVAFVLVRAARRDPDTAPARRKARRVPLAPSGARWQAISFPPATSRRLQPLPSPSESVACRLSSEAWVTRSGRIAPARRAASKARSIRKKSIGEISIAPPIRAGFREFSTRRSGKKGSRRSLSIAARRGGGTDCPQLLRSAFQSEGRSSGHCCAPCKTRRIRTVSPLTR